MDVLFSFFCSMLTRAAASSSREGHFVGGGHSGGGGHFVGGGHGWGLGLWRPSNKPNTMVLEVSDFHGLDDFLVYYTVRDLRFVC